MVILTNMNNNTTTNRPEVTTAPFVRCHGEEPRGHGFWAFQASTTRTAFDRDCNGHPEFFNGTFTEAAAQARKHFADADFVAALG